MAVKSAYESLNGWLKDLPTVQFAVLVWIFTFSVALLGVSLLASIFFAGNTLMNAAVSTVGSATGVTIVLTLGRDRFD